MKPTAEPSKTLLRSCRERDELDQLFGCLMRLEFSVQDWTEITHEWLKIRALLHPETRRNLAQSIVNLSSQG